MTNEKLRRMRVLSPQRTQCKVSNDLGITQCYYSLIETGKRVPSKKLEAKMKQYFGLNKNEDIFN